MSKVTGNIASIALTSIPRTWTDAWYANGVPLGNISPYLSDFEYTKHPLGYKTALYTNKAKDFVYNFSNTRYATFFATEEELTMMLLSLDGKEIK
jgi:hypothetical protein